GARRTSEAGKSLFTQLRIRRRRGRENLRHNSRGCRRGTWSIPARANESRPLYSLAAGRAQSPKIGPAVARKTSQDLLRVDPAKTASCLERSSSPKSENYGYPIEIDCT